MDLKFLKKKWVKTQIPFICVFVSLTSEIPKNKNRNLPLVRNKENMTKQTQKR